jgi:hypothetical protein
MLQIDAGISSVMPHRGDFEWHSDETLKARRNSCTVRDLLCMLHSMFVCVGAGCFLLGPEPDLTAFFDYFSRLISVWEDGAGEMFVAAAVLRGFCVWMNQMMTTPSCGSNSAMNSDVMKRDRSHRTKLAYLCGNCVFGIWSKLHHQLVMQQQQQQQQQQQHEFPDLHADELRQFFSDVKSFVRICCMCVCDTLHFHSTNGPVGIINSWTGVPGTRGVMAVHAVETMLEGCNLRSLTITPALHRLSLKLISTCMLQLARNVPPDCLLPWQALQKSRSRLSAFVSESNPPTLYSGLSIAIAVMDFLRLCVCASKSTNSPAWKGWPASSISSAAVEACRGLLISWVLLKNSGAKAIAWKQLPGDEDDADGAAKATEDKSFLEANDISWSALKKAVRHVSEISSARYTEAPLAAVFTYQAWKDIEKDMQCMVHGPASASSIISRALPLLSSFPMLRGNFEDVCSSVQSNTRQRPHERAQCIVQAGEGALDSAIDAASLCPSADQNNQQQQQHQQQQEATAPAQTDTALALTHPMIDQLLSRCVRLYSKAVCTATRPWSDKLL